MKDYFCYIKLNKDVKLYGRSQPVLKFRRRARLDDKSIVLLKEIMGIEIKPPIDINICKELFDKNIDFNKFHEKYDEKYNWKVVDNIMWFYAGINETRCMFFNEEAMGATKQLCVDTAVVHIGTKDDYYRDIYQSKESEAKWKK